MMSHAGASYQIGAFCPRRFRVASDHHVWEPRREESPERIVAIPLIGTLVGPKEPWAEDCRCALRQRDFRGERGLPRIGEAPGFYTWLQITTAGGATTTPPQKTTTRHKKGGRACGLLHAKNSGISHCLALRHIAFADSWCSDKKQPAFGIPVRERGPRWLPSLPTRRRRGTR